MKAVILFLKSHVAGYMRRDGTYVKPHEREDGPAAHEAPGQLALFTAPATEPAKVEKPLTGSQQARQAKYSTKAGPTADEAANPRRKYYVTMARDGVGVARLAGPFDTHDEALAHVDRAREEAEKADPRASFDSFGTAGVESDNHKPGVLNERLGIGATTGGSDTTSDKLKAADLDFQKIKDLLGNSLALKEWRVDNGGKVRAQIKTTTRGGEIKTKRLHITIVQPSGRWEYYKENAKGTFERVSSGRS